MRTCPAVLSLAIVCGCGSSPPPSPPPPPPKGTIAVIRDDDAGAQADAAPAQTAADDDAGPPDPPPRVDPCDAIAAAFEERVRPLFNTCYQEGKKKNPDLQGTIAVTLSINGLGKVTSVKPAPSELGDSVVGCMVKKLKTVPFDGEKCPSRMVAVSKTYGKKTP